jgi:hypothetical protein
MQVGSLAPHSSREQQRHVELAPQILEVGIALFERKAALRPERDAPL